MIMRIDSREVGIADNFESLHHYAICPEYFAYPIQAYPRRMRSSYPKPSL